jgi:hypothetical protein
MFVKSPLLSSATVAANVPTLQAGWEKVRLNFRLITDFKSTKPSLN